jgi:hypothetical protein
MLCHVLAKACPSALSPHMKPLLKVCRRSVARLTFASHPLCDPSLFVAPSLLSDGMNTEGAVCSLKVHLCSHNSFFSTLVLRTLVQNPHSIVK